MRTPEIRFCTSPDGVRLALMQYGDGPLLIKAATWLTHIERDMESPHTRQWIEALSRTHTFVTYDTRGCGLSDRRATDISLDAWLQDLETVVETLGVDKFSLLGISCGGAVAVAYAAKHPERVEKLIVFGGYATSYFSTGNPDPKIAEEAETLLKVAELGWGTGGQAFRQVFVSKFMPEASQDQRQAFDEYQRLTATPEMAARCLRAMFNINVKVAAQQVSCPTLVFHARGDQLINYEQGRKLAARIPGACFVPIESTNHVPFAGEACWTMLASEMKNFLGVDGDVVSDAASSTKLKLTARQTEVLRLVSQGKTDKQIARLLSLSPRTVEMHVAGALKLLECATRAEAVHVAATHGLLTVANVASAIP